MTDTTLQWWLRERGKYHRTEKRGFDTLFIATIWALWKQRNARVFGTVMIKNEWDTVDSIFDELRTWAKAGAFGGQPIIE